jgi:ATP-dependent Lhr-like helicase
MDLLWAGLVTNDTFAPLRALGRGVRTGRRTREDLAGGRWSLVKKLRVVDVADTERAYERASLLLERYGIVSRDAIEAEALEGGFGPLYKVLRAMEDAGRVRRGHFIDGLSGAQFALPGAVDRLRAARTPPSSAAYADADARVLAAIDPANPYGALLPWPELRSQGEGRPRRVAGAWVILVDGALVLYASANARQVLTFVDSTSDARGALPTAFRALHRLPRGARPRLVTIETIDDVPVRTSPHVATLEAAGFVGDYRGLTARARFGV